jgi:hypothetical protein
MDGREQASPLGNWCRAGPGEFYRNYGKKNRVKRRSTPSYYLPMRFKTLLSV